MATNLSASNSDSLRIDPSDAYHALDPEIRRWVRDQQWPGLWPVQAEAIAAILGSADDVLIAAPTAGGKTEAAFLPSLTCAANSARNGVSILYVAPLKALINDQLGRLESVCDRLGLPVVRWHGDAPEGAKNCIMAKPRGLLLITPESIEALFLRRAAAAHVLFRRLQFIVVDEVHAFLGSVRGIHLASLLRRIDALTEQPARRIGLSATIGDLASAAAWLRPDDPARVRLVRGEGGAELRLQVRGYLMPNERANPVASPGGKDEMPSGLPAVAAHLFTTLRGSNNLVFCGSRNRVEALADLLRERSERDGVPSEFLPHHGNLSKALREDLETRLKEGRLPTTAVCTSTLELGIDIGSVASVAQVGAPRSIAALRQRLGRSGRRKGTASVLRIYVLEEEIGDVPDPLDEIRPDVVIAVAAVHLLLARFNEPPLSGAGLATALLHQVLSAIAERGGARANLLYGLLCGPGPFAAVTPNLFVQLLRGMGGADSRLIEQAPDGMLMLGEAGERLVSSREFYALFQSSEEWRLVNHGHTLGTIPLTNVVSPDTLVIFAGRRWIVLSVDERARVIDVAAHTGGNIPTFERSGVEPLHDRLAEEMLAVYRAAEVPAWLDPAAADLLREGRAAFRRHRADAVRLLTHGNVTHLLTWRGTQLNATLAAALAAFGLPSEPHDLGVTVVARSPDPLATVQAALARLAEEAPDSATLAGKVAGLASAKFDMLVPENILRAFWTLANARVVDSLPEVAAGLLATQPA